MSSKSKKRPSQGQTLTKAVNNALAIFLYAFCDEFSPEQENIDRVAHCVAVTRDSVLAGSLTVPNLKKALEEDYGVTI